MFGLRSTKLLSFATIMTVALSGCSGGGNQADQNSDPNSPSGGVVNSPVHTNPTTPRVTTPVQATEDPSNQELLNAINSSHDDLKTDVGAAKTSADAAKMSADEAKAAAQAAQNEAKSAKDEAHKARSNAKWGLITGIIGAGLGAVGVGLAIWNLNRQNNNKEELKKDIDKGARRSVTATMLTAGETQSEIGGLTDLTIKQGIKTKE